MPPTDPPAPTPEDLAADLPQTLRWLDPNVSPRQSIPLLDLAERLRAACRRAIAAEARACDLAALLAISEAARGEALAMMATARVAALTRAAENKSRPSR